MKRLLALLSLTLGMTALASNPYVGQNITRTYYEGDLESCPGVLDMQPGDLWTLTFPDNITDSFLTRDGLVERKVQDNRVVMAVTATSGTSPMLVMTEDGHAPRFMITIQGGAGGRNKNVIIKPGWSGTTACGGVKSVAPAASPTAAAPVLVGSTAPKTLAVAPTKRPPAVVKPTPAKPNAAQPNVKPSAVKSPVTKPPATSPVSIPPAAVPPQVPITVAVPTPTPSASTAAKPAPIGTPTAASPQAPARVAVPTPAAPTPTVTLAPATTTSSSAILATGPTYLTATVTPQAQGRVLSIRITSRLDADVLLDEQALTLGDARSTSRRQVMVPAGEHVTLSLRLQGPLPKTQGRLLWTGSVLGSGETFLLSALLPLPT